MESALPWVALGVSLVGLFIATFVPSFVLPHPGAEDPGADEDRSATNLVLIAGAAAAVLLFLLTLPARPPWSPGQTLGRSFLLGAGAALLAVALLRHLRARVAAASQEPTAASLRFTGICGGAGLLSLALLPLALAPLLFAHDVIDALLGVALGAVGVSLLARLISGFHARTAPGLPDGSPLQGWAVYTATLAAALAFGFYHFPPAQPLARTVPLGIGAVMVLATVAGAGLFGTARTPARAFVSTGLLSVLVVAVLSVTTLPRLVPEPGAFVVVLLGIGTALLAVLLATTLPSGGPHAREGAGIVALMLLGLYVVAFDSLRGYGVGLALVGAWAAGGAGLAALCWRDLARASGVRRQRAEPEGSGEVESVALSLHHLLAVGLLALLFRLFLERYRPLATDLSLTVHFTFVGLVVGALVPALIAGTLDRSGSRLRAGAASRAGLLAAAGIAFWALGVPAAVGMAWGQRALVGLLAGLLVAGILSLLLPEGERSKGLGSTAALLAAVLMALVCVQMAHVLTPLGVLHRGIRVGILAGFAGTAVVSMLLSVLASRKAEKGTLRVETDGGGP